MQFFSELENVTASGSSKCNLEERGDRKYHVEKNKKNKAWNLRKEIYF